MNILKIAGLAALLAASTTGWGETYYKWTDDQGTTHFTASPPLDRPYTTVNTTNRINARPPATASSAEASGDAGAEEMPSEDDMPRRADPDPAVVDARCTQARENLFWLENRRRIEIERPDGTVEMIEGEAREAQIAETRAFIAEWCEDA